MRMLTYLLVLWIVNVDARVCVIVYIYIYLRYVEPYGGV